MHYACKEEKHYQNSSILFCIYHHHVQTFLFHEEEDTISLNMPKKTGMLQIQGLV